MSASESESKYPLTIEFIYNECAARLKKRKLSLKLTDAEISGDLDRKIVNRIMNNTKTRNNPYLIPPVYIKPLVNKLRLHNDYELFWGDVNDETFIEEVFCNLLTDILDEWEWNESYWDEPYCSENSEKVNIIEKVLLDDVSYAKIHSNVMSAYEYESAEGDYLPISPLAYLMRDEQVSLSERKQIRHNALLRLFKNTRPIEMFSDFFNETNKYGDNKGFSKIAKRLDIFWDRSLMPFLKDNFPHYSSLGLRVYSIVETDLKNYVELGFINYERTAAGFDSCTTPEYDEILQSLMSAGKDYINHIEKLQARFDLLYRREKFGR